MPINIAKCHCLRIGPRHNLQCKNLIINGKEISWVDEIRFLGVTICNDNIFKCKWEDAKKKFYCYTNVILGRISTSAPVNVLLKLIDSQSVPHLLYGISATTLSTKELKSFSYAYNSIFAKIFHSCDNTVILNCQYFSNSLPFHYLYDYHRYNFLNRLYNTNGINSKSEIDEFDMHDFRSLQLKYQLRSDDSKNQGKNKIWIFFENVFMQTT